MHLCLYSKALYIVYAVFVNRLRCERKIDSTNSLFDSHTFQFMQHFYDLQDVVPPKTFQKAKSAWNGSFWEGSSKSFQGRS